MEHFRTSLRLAGDCGGWVLAEADWALGEGPWRGSGGGEAVAEGAEGEEVSNTLKAWQEWERHNPLDVRDMRYW